MSIPTSPAEWGAKLKAAREAAKLSQLALAQLANVSQGSISTAEAGKSRPDVPTQVALAAALRIPVTDLFPRTDDEADLAVRCSGAH